MKDKTVLELQPKQWQLLYNCFVNNSLNKSSKQDIISDMSGLIRILCHFDLPICDKIASHLFQEFSDPGFTELYTSLDGATILNSHLDKPNDNIVYISEQDLNYLSSLYHILSTKTSATAAAQLFYYNALKLLTAFTFYYRKNYHPSTWVKYDKQAIFYLAGLTKTSQNERTELTKFLHNKYGLDMRVVGVKQPIPCFTLNWCNNQSPAPGETENNQWQQVGELTPVSVKKFSEFIVLWAKHHSFDQSLSDNSIEKIQTQEE